MSNFAAADRGHRFAFDFANALNKNIVVSNGNALSCGGWGRAFVRGLEAEIKKRLPLQPRRRSITVPNLAAQSHQQRQHNTEQQDRHPYGWCRARRGLCFVHLLD